MRLLDSMKLSDKEQRYTTASSSKSQSPKTGKHPQERSATDILEIVYKVHLNCKLTYYSLCCSTPQPNRALLPSAVSTVYLLHCTESHLRSSHSVHKQKSEWEVRARPHRQPVIALCFLLASSWSSSIKSHQCSMERSKPMHKCHSSSWRIRDCLTFSVLYQIVQ